jgi:hypothetical protein
MVPSHERGFQERSRALALSACFSSPFISTRRADSGTVAVCFSEAGGRARVFGVGLFIVVFVCLCLVRKNDPRSRSEHVKVSTEGLVVGCTEVTLFGVNWTHEKFYYVILLLTCLSEFNSKLAGEYLRVEKMNGTQTEFYFRLLLLTCLSKFHSKLAENLLKGFRCPKKIFLIRRGHPAVSAKVSGCVCCFCVQQRSHFMF